MTGYSAQIKRIKDKLITARQCDSDLMVMGARKHHYRLGEPLSEAALRAFEKKYAVKLPECFRQFLLMLGNGGYERPYAAGPFYGLYALGSNVDELVYYHPEQWLKGTCLLSPDMSKTEWETLIAPLLDIDGLTDEQNERLRGKIYGGVLPLGTQGCTYLHALVLNGEHTGKVVNLDLDYNKPTFTFEANFLDWYERWLDEVISGEQSGDDASWFGYTRGGAADELLIGYQEAVNEAEKADYLAAIESKRLFNETELSHLSQVIASTPIPDKVNLLNCLTKVDYERAKPHLFILGEQDLSGLFQCLHYHAPEQSHEWWDFIASRLPNLTDTPADAEVFQFACELLISAHEATGKDYGQLLVPFTQYTLERIKVDAIYALGQLENTSDYLDAIIPALDDGSERVIHTALQALPQPIHEKLLPHLQRVSQRFPKERNYILANVNALLKPFGLNHRTILNQVFEMP